MDQADKPLLLIDDHPLYRTGLRTALQALRIGIRVREAGSVIEALDALASNTRFRLIVYDWRLCRGDGGRRGLLALTEAAPGVPVLVLSGVDDEDARHAAASAGAVDYVLKSADAAEVCSQVRRWLERDEAACGGRTGRRGFTAPPALTPRQFDVLRGLARGMENKLIAADLHITQATVRGHVSDILRLFRARNRTQAVVRAARGGLV